MATDQEMIRIHLDTISLSSNQNRTTCPVCGPERRKHNEKSLSILIDGDFAVYKCHHCEISGSILIREEEPLLVRRSRLPSRRHCRNRK